MCFRDHIIFTYLLLECISTCFCMNWKLSYDIKMEADKKGIKSRNK